MGGNSSTGSNTNTILDHEDYFIGLASLFKKRSPDPVTQVGACIVNQKGQVVSLGYNSMPRGCERFSWSKDSDDPLERKTFYVCHAELNAIMDRNCYNLENCIMYVTHFPCNECAKLIIQSGIKSVKYLLDKNPEKYKYKASKKMLSTAGIAYSEYKNTRGTTFWN